MANRKPIIIDGYVKEVSPFSSISDLVSPQTQSVVTSKGELIPRERFTQVPLPDGFESNLAAINKGGGARQRSGSTVAQTTLNVLLITATAWLTACSSTPKENAGYTGPQFPPHLAHLALHPFFSEGCNRTGNPVIHVQNLTLNYSSNQRNYGFIQYSGGADQRGLLCAQLQQHLRQTIAKEDARFRANNRCVGRTVEINGRVHRQTRECVDVKDGYDALSHIETRQR